MHVLIPFAAPAAEEGRMALRELSLPNLSALLSGTPLRDDGDAFTFSPPHERALAAVLGLSAADGSVPWAAYLAAGDSVDAGTGAWGLMTPAHWHVGADQVTLLDPEELQLDAGSSRALLESLRELLAADGYEFAYGAPLRWYVTSSSLAGVRTASLDRVIGRNVDDWLAPRIETRAQRRLQNEVQMALHEHPVNVAREARGLAPVNSVWLSGCGVAQQAGAPDGLQVDGSLRRSALAADWSSWQRAWRDLDAGPLAELQPGSLLTLCGERASATWTVQAPSLWRRLSGRAAGGVHALLESL